MESKILTVVGENPGIKAREIAARLGVDKAEVNTLLYGRLKSKVHQDRAYGWYLRESPVPSAKTRSPDVPLDTPLAKLCRYYLDCLSNDIEHGASCFASSKYGPDYVEVGFVPFVSENETDLFADEAPRRLLSKVRRDRSRLALYLGYPTRLRRHNTADGREFTFVEPIFLFPFYFDPSDRYSTPTVSEDLPNLNFLALKWLNTLGAGQLMEEAIELAEELGLAVTVGEESPDLDEVFLRLQAIRPEWDWKEAVDPHNLFVGASLSTIKEAGIYNRAVLVSGERSPYTQGLESELSQLARTEVDKTSGTALGAWLALNSAPAPDTPDISDIIEVVPLNSEQRQAVQRGLHDPLTVITGPPGTGKSQVVMSLLINAAWQGKRVLFASKNNKAVDVVEERVNSLGARPILLRLGSNEYRQRLADYLTSVLAASATAEDEEHFQQHLDIHRELRQNLEGIEDQRKALIDCRNAIDSLEQTVEDARSTFGDKFALLNSFHADNWRNSLSALMDAVAAADYKRHNPLGKLLLRLLRKTRLLALRDAEQAVSGLAELLNLGSAAQPAQESSILDHESYAIELTKRLNKAEQVNAYFHSLDALQSMSSLEQLTARHMRLSDELADNSEELWRTWVVLQAAKLTIQQRQLLGEYASLIHLLARSKEDGGRTDAKVYQRFRQMFPEVAQVLSCWAVTSLSARGQLPLQPKFFDLLIIDEASQCDIASALPLLYRAERAVIIGDPHQLRHITQLSPSQDRQLMAKNEILEFHTSWAYSTNSLFDLACTRCESHNIVNLRDHHRSHSDIISFSNEEFYDGRLRVATKYDRLRRPANLQTAVNWIHVSGHSSRPPTGGAVNETEARSLVQQIENLVVDRQYKGTVGVVSPFRAQANRIRQLVNESARLSERLPAMELLVDTVHRFQGDERDVMFFSPTVSSGFPEGAKGFLRSHGNLFNVAITRARAALWVVGDLQAALASEIDYLVRFAEYTQQLAQKAKETGQIREDLGPRYPPVSRPELVSDWERMLYKEMYKAGLRAIPQYDEEQYILDFALFAGNQKLDLEVDGERYHRDWNGDLCRRDVLRGQRLLELGWHVKRFWVYELRDRLPECIAWLKDWEAKAAAAASDSR